MYCESDRGRKQLALLDSLSAFQVVSGHPAVNAGSCSADQLKDNLNPLTDVANDSRSPGCYEADEDQETPHQKKARLEQFKPRSYLSPKENNNAIGTLADVSDLTEKRDRYVAPCGH